MQTTLDSILGRATEDGRLPGVVAVVVDRDGVAYEGAFGVRSLETGVVMSTDTVVRVACDLYGRFGTSVYDHLAG